MEKAKVKYYTGKALKIAGTIGTIFLIDHYTSSNLPLSDLGNDLQSKIYGWYLAFSPLMWGIGEDLIHNSYQNQIDFLKEESTKQSNKEGVSSKLH